MVTNIDQELHELIQPLSDDDKQDLIRYIRQRYIPQGTPGDKAVRMAQELDFDDRDLDEIETAVNELRRTSRGFPDIDLDE